MAFYFVGRMLFPAMTTTLAQHFLMVPLTLFTMAVPLPFGALGLSEGVGDQLFKLVNHPSGGLAMMGFRVLMYGGGLVGAIVYLAKIKEVRGLTASAHQIEEELMKGNWTMSETESCECPDPGCDSFRTSLGASGIWPHATPPRPRLSSRGPGRRTVRLDVYLPVWQLRKLGHDARPSRGTSRAV